MSYLMYLSQISQCLIEIFGVFHIVCCNYLLKVSHFVPCKDTLVLIQSSLKEGFYSANYSCWIIEYQAKPVSELMLSLTQ